MGIFDFVKKSISDLYIASPPFAGDALLWRHPDQSIPNAAKLTVRDDEVALFYKEGRLLAELKPGTYMLRSEHLPFLGDLIVSPLTGDNHYLTELFFVRRTELLHRTRATELGSFTDVTSQLVVSIEFEASFGVRVSDAARLVGTLGGQNAASSERVAEFLDGRVSSLLAALVGRLVSIQPVLSVASNQFGEELGQMLLERARTEFSGNGLDVVRFVQLRLVLDAESELSLRDFGRRKADLTIQREGVELANQPGFAAYHLVQGQRAALEGLGKGMAEGNLSGVVGLATGVAVGSAVAMGSPPAVLVPTGAGFVVPPASSLASALPPHRGAPRWFLRTPQGIEGPMGARQLVLRAGAAGLEGTRAEVRKEGSTAWMSAAQDEALAGEFERRQTAMRPPLPVRSGEPPPLSIRAFVYSNGIEQLTGLSPEAIAKRVRASPDGVHMVWAPGMGSWKPAAEVDEIEDLLSR